MQLKDINKQLNKADMGKSKQEHRSETKLRTTVIQSEATNVLRAGQRDFTDRDFSPVSSTF